MKLKLLAVLAVASIVTAACSTTPTAAVRAPGGAAFDGGLGMGSGNKADSTANKNTASGGSDAVPGGLGMGSGN